MEKRELLRKAVAEFFQVDASQVGQTFPLMGPLVASSVGRAALASRIRHQVGLKSSAVFTAVTYGELEAEIISGGANDLGESIGSSTAAPNNGSPRIATRRTSPSPQALGGQVACGVDIELIDSLPATTDYWEDSFYRATFTPAEIAYCLMQERPALHLAARWCAKEALKKSDPDFLSEEMNNLEVVFGESHQPSLNHYVGGEVHRLPHSVSISHTPLAAIAIVIRVGIEPFQPLVAPTTIRGASGATPEPSQFLLRASRRRLVIVQILLSIAALSLSILALLKSYHLY